MPEFLGNGFNERTVWEGHLESGSFRQGHDDDALDVEHAIGLFVWTKDRADNANAVILKHELVMRRVSNNVLLSQDKIGCSRKYK